MLLALRLLPNDPMKTHLKEPYKQFFGTLANQVRIDIIAHLSQNENQNGSDGSNVSKIVQATGHQQSTVSHSLKRLELCGFVRSRAEGKERIYTLNHETIKPLFDLMKKHVHNYCAHVVHQREKHHATKD